MASVQNEGEEEKNRDIIKAMQHIEKIIITFASDLRRKIERSAEIQSEPTGNAINLSKHKFSKAVYSLQKP